MYHFGVGGFLAGLLTGLLSLGATLAHADGPIDDFKATYKARYYGIGVTAIRQLESLPEGGHRLTFSADSWLADLKETVSFAWNDDDHMIPQTYSYERSGLGRDRQAALDFNWETNTIVNDVENKPWTMDIPDGALDKLGYQLQIQADLINGKTLPEYDIADGGKLKHYQFKALGEEILETPAGTFETVKVKRLRERDKDRHTVFWMAKNWDYLLVRLQQEEDDGDSYEIDLHSAVVNGREVTGIDSD